MLAAIRNLGGWVDGWMEGSEIKNIMSVVTDVSTTSCNINMLSAIIFNVPRA